MNKPCKKPIIGIIGAIASGKTTAAKEFVKLGCGLVDADKIAHEVLDEPKIKEKLIAVFGTSVLDRADKVDHKKLADIVFTDPAKLKQLTDMVHPLVLKRSEQLIDRYNHTEHVQAIVLDMPLLVEIGWDKRCDTLIFIDCKEPLRASRAEKKAGFDKNQLKIRENFQISLDKKAGIADNTIENSSDLSSLTVQITNIFSNIIDDE